MDDQSRAPSDPEPDPSDDGQVSQADELIKLIDEKTRYQVGDRARVLINSPFAGEALALVTIERADVISHELIALDGGAQIYEFQITPAHVPHIHISVFIVKPMDEHRPVAAYRMGFADLRVDAEKKTLNLDVSAVGDSASRNAGATYEFRVTDHQGVPVEAEVSIALVDPTAHPTRSKPNLSLMEAFYGHQQLSVSTSSSLVISAESKPGDLYFWACCLDGGAPPDVDMLNVPGQIIETPYWNPTIRTDTDGVATFALNLPDNLPVWNLDIRAISASADGNLLIGEKTVALSVNPNDTGR